MEKRKVFTQKERLEFADRHGRECAKCGQSELLTGTEAKDLYFETGVYKPLPSDPFFDGMWKLATGTKRGAYTQVAHKGNPKYDNIARRIAHIDHVIPLSRGGNNEESNLQLLCAACNLKKADKSDAR